MKLRMDDTASPIGTITLVATGDRLCALDFADCRTRMLALLRARYGRLELERTPDPNGYTSRVRAYFEGELGALGDVSVDPGGTPFQQSVWSALRRVPAGATVSYGGLAASLGRPSATRAVGLANARNPICLVIPCHRVIGADGSLTGYGGGLERKRWLLEHEARHAPAITGAGALPRPSVRAQRPSVLSHAPSGGPRIASTSIATSGAKSGLTCSPRPNTRTVR